VSDLGAIHSRVSAAWLRRRFADGPAMDPFGDGSEAAAAEDLIRASVLVPVVQREPDLTVLFTRRTAHLHDHPGQVAFPGGRSEAADETPVVTALREAEEEIGLLRSQVDVLGVLPEYFTSTGFRVTPVVGLVSPPLVLRLDAFEVAEVFEAPLWFLLDPRNHQRQAMEFAGALRQFWAMPFQGHHIWGATAGMVVSLHRFLFGIGT
jgi:8-oxo-dGTP pyrophosphatase MutT (NUDIX family)